MVKPVLSALMIGGSLRWSASAPSGMSRRIDWPIISDASYPKIRSAAGFQDVTIPSRFLLMIASSEPSMNSPAALTATAPGGALPGPTGTTGVNAAVTPGVRRPSRPP